MRVRESGIVHLATHAEFLPGEPSNSYIQFWDAKLTLDILARDRLEKLAGAAFGAECLQNGDRGQTGRAGVWRFSRSERRQVSCGLFVVRQRRRHPGADQ